MRRLDYINYVKKKERRHTGAGRRLDILFSQNTKERRMNMQDSETMANMMKDMTQYIMMPKIRYAQGVGTYVSYDIAAYDCFARDIVALVPDVTADRDTALHIVGQLNKHQLSPIHLNDAILDMLK